MTPAARHLLRLGGGALALALLMVGGWRWWPRRGVPLTAARADAAAAAASAPPQVVDNPAGPRFLPELFSVGEYPQITLQSIFINVPLVTRRPGLACRR